LFYSTGATLAYINDGTTNYPTDSTSLANVDSTKHQNTLVGDPIFAGPNDLHVFGPLANDAGDNSVGITVDIDATMQQYLCCLVLVTVHVVTTASW